jgi:hypothetical protein
LLDEYEVQPDQCERELEGLLNDMNSRGLVSVSG